MPEAHQLVGYTFEDSKGRRDDIAGAIITDWIRELKEGGNNKRPGRGSADLHSFFMRFDLACAWENELAETYAENFTKYLSVVQATVNRKCVVLKSQVHS
eukprot:2753829-Pyramimonas_sp.AAC.1